MLTSVKIAIAEPSAIVRAGLEAQLRKLQHYKAQIIYLMDEQRREWQDVAAVISADIYLINPMLTGANPRAQLPDLAFETKLMAIDYGGCDPGILREYDGVIRITDSPAQISEAIDILLQNEQAAASANLEAQMLTPRVGKGMTNKEIAGQLYLSTHTVITHRRNISKKLQIHSPSGLTIYAIMNKLVELEDIKDEL